MNGRAASPSSAGDTVPPFHTHRTLVLCLDGTGNKINQRYSNVAQFVSLIKKDDRSQQIMHYQTGIGTWVSPRTLGPLTSKIAKTVDSMVARSIAEHIKDGYRFLMENYHDGDHICIFGFSRGAYTARAVAGMIHKVGLLPPSNTRHVQFAYDTFIQNDEAGWRQAADFKRCFSIDVEIEFVGIWDSVCSVGVTDHGLPFSDSNTTIKTFRHALSLDERRVKFKANAWQCFHKPTARHRGSRPDRGQVRELLDLDDMYAIQRKQPTDVKEVYFAGCHSDVGGGSVSNDTRHALSRISLRWMVRECFLANTGILFSVPFLREVGIDPDRLYPIVLPRPAPLLSLPEEPHTAPEQMYGYGGDYESAMHLEEMEDYHDARAPINDRLGWPSIWWMLEVLPMSQSNTRQDGSIATSWRPNFGKGRCIGEQVTSSGILMIHRSVKQRMDLDGYVPKAKIDGTPIWVD